MTSPWYGRGYSVGKRLRWTVVLSVIAFGIGASATFYWHTDVFGFLLAPAGELLSPFGGMPVYNAVPDMFGATLNLSIAGGKLAAFPVLVVGFLSLLRPLVPSRWWRFLTTYTALTLGLFLTGVSFVYFVMMPVSLNFLLTFGSDIAVPVILLDEYMKLLTSLFGWIGLVFLLPVIMNLLARFRLLSYRRAKGVHRIVPWVVLFFSAIISPGLDGLLTVFVAVPMYLLYLVGLGGVWLAHPEDGNYLWLGTIGRWLRKVRNGIVWVVRRPVVMKRWVRWKVWEYSSGWWH